MKKKLLFVIPSLDAGGGEKSLVNLLNTMNFDHYEVDLMVFQPKGLFLSSIPKHVTLLTIEGNYTAFTGGLAKACRGFLKAGQFNLIFHRITYTLKNKIITNKGFAEQSSWKNLSKAIPVSEKKYDVAIGFLEKTSNYFVVDKVRATQKIGWIHTNYAKSGMKASFDLPYFEKMDTVVSVSNECEADLKLNFPTLAHKFKIIHNIVSAKLIHQLSDEKPAIALDWSKFTISTVARLSPEKGCDMAVEACKILKDKGLSLQWLLIGDGNERKNLEEKVTSYGLQNQFLFLGLQANPYPFVKKATVYVQPSRYEGKSIAIDEAKILQKPIVVTDFDTAKDQLIHLKTGIICPMHPSGLAEEIFKIYHNTDIQNNLILNLSLEQVDSEQEIEKLYAVIHD
jgi:glycosyltransferase involved in cell wall biosynthesis